MKYLLVIALFTLSTDVYAQQSTADIGFLQRAVTALQTQRNQAYDQAAASDAKAAGLTEDLTKANAKIKELEDKQPKDK